MALEPRMMFDAAAPAMVRAAFADSVDGGPGDRGIFSGPRPDHQPSSGGETGPHVAAAVNGGRFTSPAGDAPRAHPAAAAPDALTPRTEAAVVAAPAAGPSRQIIFIDTSVQDYQQLARDWAKQGEVILVDKDRDGLAQIQAALAGRTDLSAIHIVSHGEEGALLLGSTKLDEASITGSQAQSLAAIGRSLGAGGDILVYGCDFAEGDDGARALESLAAATGADVAASTNLTGDAALGGDWTLEAQRGQIETRSLAESDWRHTLDPGPVNAVPISVAADSLTVTDGNGVVVASGATGFTADGNTRSPNVGAGATARWANAATQSGQSYDLVATIVSITSADTVRFLRPTGQTANNKPGDDPTFLLVDNSGTSNSDGDGASVQVQWRLVLAGTNTVAPADVTFNILDIDGRAGQPTPSRESVTAKASELYYYTHETNSDIVFNYDTANNIVTASGTQDENNPTPTNLDLSTKSQASFSYKNTSGFTLTYSLAPANTVTRMAQFYHDGDSDFIFTTPVYASIPHLDLDGDDSTASGSGAHFTFTEKGAAVPVVDSDIVVTNPEAVNSIVSGSITLTNAKTGDVLNVGTLPPNITATVVNSAGQITVSLSGAGSETDYEAAFQAITFRNTSAAPDATQRVLNVAFTNDTNYAVSATSLIDVVPVNDAPVNTLPASYSVAEDGGPLALSGVSVADVDAGAGALTITLSVPNGAGVLAASTAGGVTVTGSGTRAVTLSGTLTALNTYLAGASTQPTFTGAPDYSGAVTLTMVTSDNGNTGSGGALTDTDTSTITVTPVNDAPVNTLPSSYSVAEDGGALALSGISVGDVDAGTGALTITLSVPSGAGTLSGASSGGVTATGAGGSSVTLNGTLTALNSYLASAATRPTFTAAANSTGPVTLTMVTNDNGNTGSGGAMSDTDTSTINVTPVNDAPVNTLPASYSVAEDGGPLALSGLSVADPDAGSGALTITLSVPSGAGALSATTAGGVTATGSGGSSITLNGTLGALNAYLASASTRPTFTGAPDYNGAVTLTMSTNDNGNTGAGGAMTDTDTSTITVTPVNDAPVNTLPSSYSVAAGGGALALSGVSVSDVDAGAGPLTITLSVPSGAGVLAATSAGGVTATGSGGSSVTLNGTLTALNGYLASAATRPTFTAATNSTGPVTLTMVTNDNGNTGAGGALTDTDTSTITIVQGNRPPAAAGSLPDRAAQDAQSVTYATAGGFTDPDGDTLSYTAAGLPTGLSIDPATGVVSGTVDRSASQAAGGVYTASVTARDPSGATATQSFRITVTNPVPTARADQATTSVNTPVTVAVLANDTDPDGDPLTVTAVGAAAHGVVTRNADGTVTYTPATGYTGSDTFTYTLSDGQGGTSMSTVGVTIAAAANGAPTARPDPATTSADMPVTVAVLANDTDPDGDPLTVTAVGPAAHGAVVRNADGTLTYTPAAGYTGPDSFTYTVSDGRGGTATSTVAVTVGPAANRAPTARADQTTAPVNMPTTLAVLANDTDPDGDPLTVTAVGPAAHGAVVRNADGTLTYTPVAGYTGPDSFTYTVADGRGGVSNATVAVTVVQAQNGPPTARPDQATTTAGTPVTVAALANDTDPDGDPLTVTAVGPAAHGAVVRNADGTLTYTPVAGYTGPDSFTYTVSDGRGGVSNATVAVTVVQAQNGPPAARPDQATTTAGRPVTVAALANDTDPDGDPLAVTAVSAPAHGAAALNADGTLTYTPDAGYTGPDSFTYTISDGRGGVATSTVTVTVASAPNGAPTPLPDQAATSAGTPATVAVLANDTDPDGDPLTVTAVSAPAHGAAALNVDGTLTYTPDAGYTGTDSFTYTVSDGRGGTSTATVAVTVAASNGAPTARPDQVATSANTPVTVAVLANDTDPDGDPLSIVALGTPAHGGATLNAGGGVTYTPAAGYAGPDSFTYTVSDGRGGVSTSTVEVAVAPAADNAPLARPDQAVTSVNTPATIAVLANDTDADGDPLTIIAVGAPAHGAVVRNDDGTLTYTPAVGYTGADSFTYMVSDGRGGVSTAAVDVTVAPAADVAPTARPDQAATPVNTPVTVAVLANDTDPDGDALAVTAVGAPAHGAVTRNPDGTLTYTPDAGYTGPDSFSYTISDGRGGVATSTVDVTVAPAAAGALAGAPRQATTLENTSVAVDVSGAGDDVRTLEAVRAVTGAVTVGPNGVLTYTPRQNFTGVDTITYTISDARGVATTFSIAVRVSAPTADVDQLLEIGRVKVDAAPPVVRAGVGRDVAGDAPWLSVREAVDQARSLGAHGLGARTVRDAVDDARSLYGTSLDASRSIAGENRRLADRAGFRDAGDRAFDQRWDDFAPRPLSGFSCAAEGDAGVMFQSVVRGGAIYLDVCDTATDGRAPITDLAVLTADGGAPPGWIKVDPRGLAIIERPADVDELHLVLEVRRQDGRVVRTPVVIQGATGEIELDRREAVATPDSAVRGVQHRRNGPLHPHRQERPRAAPLDATLSTLDDRSRLEAEALGRTFR